MKKTKAPLLILALAALAAMLYVVNRPAATDPYESFTLAMDRLYGPGQWSAQGHEGSSGGLTVKGLKLPLSLGSGDDAQPLILNADSVFIKKLPPKSQMEKLVSLANWQGQPETLLAELLRFQGLRVQGGGDFKTKMEIEELNLESMKLAQAGSSGPAGEAGFWKAFRLGAVDYKNLNITVKAPEAEASAVVESAAFEGLGFGGDMPRGLVSLLESGLDPTGDLKVLGGLNFKSLKAAGLKMDFQGLAPEAEFQAGLSLDALEETNVQAFKSVGALKLTGFKSRLTDDEGQVISLNLAEFSLRGLEAADYLTKLLAGLAEVKDSPESAQILLAGQFTLADFFVSPISLEEMTLTGLDLDFAGLATIKLAEMKAVGPYQAGEIPASVKSWMRGLEINLPGDPQAGPDTPGRDIYELSQKLGRNAFSLEAEVEGAYEAGKGLWTTRLNRFSVRDLFDLSLGISWGGLTLNRLEKFKQTPLSALYLAALNPGDLLGDSSFEAFNLKYTDQGLVDLIFNLKAAEEDGRITGAELKDRTIAQAGLMLMIGGAQYLKNVEALSRPLLNFLKAPGSLEIDLKPAQPLTFLNAASTLGGEPLAILDALNITISANGEAGSPLRFVTGSAYEDDE